MHRRTDDLPRGAEDIMVDDQVPRLCFGRSGWDVVGGQAADDGDRYAADDRMIGCDQPAGDGAAEDLAIGARLYPSGALQYFVLHTMLRLPHIFPRADKGRMPP